MKATIAAIFCVFISTVSASAIEDIVIADFEGKDYGDWKVEGNAFGVGPARGTLPSQQNVSGFEGRGFVNSYRNGDGATGTLTSPELKIERKYINFLIGGGNRPNEACINLLVDGKVVRTTTGGNDERLEWGTWNVEDLVGKTVRIQIVDKATGDWGHINMDQIVQSDASRAVPEKLYDELYRPQFHFSAEKNWLNDPNGMVFYRGAYHLFFQHNPKGIQWGNMTWGHATSEDMIHWKQQPHALHPDKLGTIFSGSAVVDWKNTSGFKTGEKDVLVCMYTSAGDTSPESKGQPFTQSLAYSNDGGRTWTKYAKNPVLKHIVAGNRDPKVIWHAPTKQWIMALFLDKDDYALFSSPNLKEWTKICDLKMPGVSECPDFFELPVDGNAKKTKWVFWGANNSYMIGAFDGKHFVKESGPLQSHFGKNRYAAQTFSDIPTADGRRIQIAWMTGGQFPRMPFSQQMSFPAALTLRTFSDGIRLCILPVKEIETLHGEKFSWSGPLKSGQNPLAEVSGDLFDIRLEIEPAGASEINLNIRGAPIIYNVKDKTLTCMGASAPVALTDGRLSLQVLVDRASLEIFVGEGRVNMAFNFVPPRENKTLSLSSQNGEAMVRSLTAWKLNSIWTKQ
jgi:fructan beta-fructosidase